MTVIRIVGLVSGGPSPFDGQYLKEYDPDRRGIDPDGHIMLAHVTTTPNPDEAMRFAGVADAQGTWARKSTRWPIRPDGQPNRPLTAFTVSLETT